MFVMDRPVRFADVDAAHIVFFARHVEYCHDAIEALFSSLDGGYPGLTMGRGVGVPTVRLEVDYRAPLRYGDVVEVHVEVLRLGGRSVTFRHNLHRKSDGVLCATVVQVVVTSDLHTLKSVAVPDDVRALLSPHVVA